MQSAPHSLSAKNLDGVSNPQNGDLLEYKDDSWVSKPKTKRYLATGLGYNPSGTLNFIGPKVITTIEKENPVISIHLTKLLGATVASGGQGLTLSLGYRKNNGPVVKFDELSQSSLHGMRVVSGVTVPFTLSGTFNTTFQPGDNLEIGIVGFSTNFASWNNNGEGMGYVEISY